MKSHLLLFATILWSFSLAQAQPEAMKTENMLFPPMPIGATREQELLVRGLSAQASYRLVTAPNMPFEFISTVQDLTVRAGVVTLRVRCSPMAAGDYEDEVLLERQPQTGNPSENTIKLRLSASAFRIERQDELDFGTLTVADSAQRVVLFRIGPADDVRWEYTRAPQAPFRSTTINGPIRRGRDTLAFVFTFHPTSVGRFRDTVGIMRIGRMGQRLDTAWFYLNGVARPRPLTLRLAPRIERYDARIGDTITLDVLIQSDGPIDVPERMQRLSFDVGYNPTMLVPIFDSQTSPQSLNVRDGRQLLTVRRDAFAGGDLIVDTSGISVATLRFAVALGDAESSPLTLESFRYVDRSGSEKSPPTTSSFVNVTNVWRYQDGRSRLVNPLQGPLVLDVDPNPVETVATMRVRNLPPVGGTLVIANSNGARVADLTGDIVGGKRDFTIASSGVADVVLPRGTYFARLAVESQLGGTLLSVVRLIIVQ
jgi:hypothetical protein